MFKKNVGNCGFSVKHEKKIWYGRRYAGYRRRFAEGDVKGMICACCRKQLPQKKESLRLNIQRFEVWPSRSPPVLSGLQIFEDEREAIDWLKGAQSS